MNTTSNAKTSSCNCIIRHAVSDSERAAVVEQLNYSRSIQDTTGIMIAMVALQEKCPSTNIPEVITEE